MNKDFNIEKFLASMKKAEQEREATRQEMEGLIFSLLKFDSEDLGNAVKCYIQENGDTDILTDDAFEAFSIIAKIKVLEWEC